MSADDFIQRRYGHLVEACARPAWIRDACGRFHAANATFARSLGRPPERIAGREDAEVLGDRDARRYLASDRRVLEAGRTVVVEEQPDDHTAGWFRTTKVPLRGGDGRFCAVLGFARRIADWRELERLAAAAGAEVDLAWLREARAAIDDRFREKLEVGRLAEGLRMHPDHLARAFRRGFGLSVRDYLRTRRVAWAARALEETGEPIVEVALAAGFYDQSHFTRTFGKVIGMSPASFRRRLARARRR